jgi:hypothetical protein
VYRPFTIADIGHLSKTHKRTLFLNGQAALIQSPNAFQRNAFLAPLASLTGISTDICLPAGIIAQSFHRLGSPLAHVLAIAPGEQIDSSELHGLLDYVLKAVATNGAHALAAETAEGSPEFVALRQAGFGIYARQRVWRMETMLPESGSANAWRPYTSRDEFAVQLLRNSLMPGQVQQIESGLDILDGYVIYQDGELLAYAQVLRGRRGIWLEPFVQLDAEPFDLYLADLLAKLRPRASRPVYVCLRSTQDWLERALYDFGALPGPRQVVMAKRAVVPVKVEEGRRVRAANRRTEPTTPIHASDIERRREPEWMSYDKTPNYR